MDYNCYITLQSNSEYDETGCFRPVIIDDRSRVITACGVGSFSTTCRYEPGRGIIVYKNVIFREDEFEQFYTGDEHYNVLADAIDGSNEFLLNTPDGAYKYYFLCASSTEDWTEEHFCGKKDSVLIKTDKFTLQPFGEEDEFFIPLCGMHVHVYIAKENYIKPAK